MPYKHMSILAKLHIKYHLLQFLPCHVTMSFDFFRQIQKNPPFKRSPTASQDVAADPIPSRAAVKKCEVTAVQKHGSNWGVVTCDLEITLVICNLPPGSLT